jgi:hypothetical protein
MLEHFTVIVTKYCTSLNNVRTLYSDSKQILYSLNNVRTLYSDNKQILYSLNNVRTLYSDSNQILYSLNNVRTLYSDSKQILYSLNNVRTLYSDNKQILYKSNSVRTLFFYSDSRHQIKMGYRSKFSGADHPSVKVRGGPGRNHEVVMELQLTKVYCIYLYHPILITPFPHLLQWKKAWKRDGCISLSMCILNLTW